MSVILDFNEIRKEDIGVAGGKGANLGELTAAGLNVPNGFVLTAEVYNLFLRENGLEQMFRGQLAEAGDDEAKLMRIAKALQTAIQHGRFPQEIEALIREKYSQLGDKLSVAVRSSATAEDLPDASFAGQQESCLNVVGAAAVLNSVRRCYASLWGRRAVSYRVHQGYAQNSVSIAVIVQEMVESEKSGVLFTVNPLSKKENEMQINASYGLGESVVSGSVSADSYIVDKSGEILEITIGSKATQIVYADKAGRGMYADKPASNLWIAEADTAGDTARAAAAVDIIERTAAAVDTTVELAVSETLRKARALDDGEIQALVQAGLAIERHYGLPMDIEWAIKRDKLYILQARAITTLGPTEDTDRLVRAYTSKVRLNGSIRANMSFFLEKIPLAYRVLDFDFMMAISGQKTRIFAEGGLIADSNPRMDEDGIQMLPLGKRGINRHIVHIFKILREMKDFERCSLSCEKFMDEYRQELARIKMLSFDEMDISGCADFLKHSYSLTQRLAYDRFKYALFPTMLMFDKYTRVIRKVDKSYAAFDFYWGLDNQTAVFSRDVEALAERIRRNPELSAAVAGGERFRELCSGFEEFRLLSDEFMRAHGFKSDYNCYCLEAQNFIENPDRLVHILRPLLSVEEGEETECGEKAGAEERARGSAEARQRAEESARGSAEARQRAEESARGSAEARESAGERTKERAGEKSRDFDELMSQLRLIYKRRYRILERRIACFRYFHVVREETQYMWETLFFFVRKCVERVNRLLLDSDDYRTGVANLFYEELLEAMARGYLNESDMEKIARRNDNFPISQKVWEASKLLVFDARGALLRGVSGSAGVAVGKACIIRSPQEFYKMQRGDVLVCQLTDPEWTPLFKLASAVVADTGAALSHAAIVAREFNIPAVLGVGFATTRFKDGDMLQVDGDRGMVRGLAYEYKS